MKKRVFLITVLFALCLTVCCAKKQEPAVPEKTAEPVQTTQSEAETPEITPQPATAEIKKICLPALITTCGQSADYKIISTVLKKQGIDHTSEPMATVENLQGVNTLIIVVGGSTKGLGAAGINSDQEQARVNELIAAAKAQGAYIIVMHTGGSARRGELSDKFISPTIIQADYAIVLEAGDQDKLMFNLCQEKAIKLEYVSALNDLSTVLPNLFK